MKILNFVPFLYLTVNFMNWHWFDDTDYTPYTYSVCELLAQYL